MPHPDKWKDRYFVKREGLCDPVGTSESGIRSAWTERASNLSERLRITAEQKNVIRALFRTKTKSLLSILSEDSFRSARYWPASEETSPEQQAEQNLEEEDPSTQLSEEIPEGIPLPTLEVPYLHILEGCIRLLYGVPTDPLWASYPAADMGKLKMKISKAELEATKKKKKDKQAAAKGGASSASDKGQERPTLNVVVEPSSLPIAIPSGDSPPPKRPRRSSPPALAQDKGKEKQTTSMLGLEDSSTIRSDSSLVGPIVDSLMTRHDRRSLKEMTPMKWAWSRAKCLEGNEHYSLVSPIPHKILTWNVNCSSLRMPGTYMMQSSRRQPRRTNRGAKRAKWKGSGPRAPKAVEKDREWKPSDFDYAQVREEGRRAGWRWPQPKAHLQEGDHQRHPQNTNDMIEASREEDGSLPTPAKRWLRGHGDHLGEDEPDEGDASREPTNSGLDQSDSFKRL
ncbi:hypothetical protein FNV43_RR02636 [Rhamnella rubrinervis]|uniref:Uncharacterized protein n=1 Tax=Rhamnella rubrinervis TaxID=2594499 RepID=A0A8K0HSW0_9ROSA|nr:hypothetical protein FNV43_RR02636 [Rhamnella rubrinervis]